MFLLNLEYRDESGGLTDKCGLGRNGWNIRFNPVLRETRGAIGYRIMAGIPVGKSTKATYQATIFI
jgi:hypothetical protein